MEELLSVLKLYIDLKYFNVQHEESKELEGHTLFTLTPFKDPKFDSHLYTLIVSHFPTAISCSMTDMNIQFAACKDEQEALVDAFCEILRRYLANNLMFFSLLEASQHEQPFVRLLQKYTIPTPLPTIAPSFPLSAPPAPLPSPSTATAVAPRPEKVITETITVLEEIPAIPPASASANRRMIPFVSGSQHFFVPEDQRMNPEQKLTVNLQASLSSVVAEMKKRTQANGGYLASLTQSVFNSVNMLVGDDAAAINQLTKFEAHARHTIVSNGLFVPYNTVETIIQDIATRVLHIQQSHLKDNHQQEITYLLSAQDYAIKLRDLLIRSSRGPIPTAQSGGLSPQASLGSHS